MRCKRSTTYALLILLAACSRETPAPPETATTGGLKPAAPKVAPPSAPLAARGTYADAMMWMKSTPGFRFVLEEDGVRAEGSVTRERIGTEKVELTVEGKTWRAAAGPRGIVWTPDGAPAYAGRMYQRVTIAFDPQKKEGEAKLVGTEGGANHYRFTDANSGKVHDVWVSTSDGHIEKMTIGDDVKLTITGAR